MVPSWTSFPGIALGSLLALAGLAMAVYRSIGRVQKVALAAATGAKALPAGNHTRLAPPPRRNITRCANANADGEMEHPKYCESYVESRRRPTHTVWIGKVPVGSEHPLALQTMTTTNTRDVEATVTQCKKVADAGADIVRITVQGMKEAEACMEIKNKLVADGYDIPLVADIHFAPKVALKVAEAVDKIRVNPGNFMDGAKKFDDDKIYTDEEYEAELEAIEELFTPLVLKCKELGRAIRIGTNHGSLSARTLARYGDTADGMVESAFEFARICRKLDFHNFVFSMKASNPLVMVQAYRLLAARMYEEGWTYPLHLGVTEAGEGEDGRMKSAIGIGALLLDGLGDTIRVSLTEDPDLEIKPCKILAGIGQDSVKEAKGVPDFGEDRQWRNFGRREADLPAQREGDVLDYRSLLHRDGSVLAAITAEELAAEPALYSALGCKTAVGMPFKDIATVDSVLLDKAPTDEAALKVLRRLQEAGLGVFIPLEELQANPVPNAVALMTMSQAGGGAPELPEGCQRFAVTADGTETAEQVSALKGSLADLVLFRPSPDLSYTHVGRRFFEYLRRDDIRIPVIFAKSFEGVTKEELVLQAGSQIGSLLVDGMGEGVMLQNPGGSAANLNELRLISFGQLQGCRMRNTKTEFVSCPSCGRTLFDLQEVTAQIAEKTGHLPGVAIAVMGCIVNGPGEMADADFGYVGTVPGKIDLYVGREVVKKGIPMESATDELIELIKEYGRWVDPEPAEEELVAEAV
jgi:(E)-4-hydroxy-3-methylbut-2-enyl-diphosphate synthase